MRKQLDSEKERKEDPQRRVEMRSFATNCSVAFPWRMHDRTDRDVFVCDDQLQECIREGRAAMLADLRLRWIHEIRESAKKFYLCASICDPRFKDLAFLDPVQDQHTKKTIIALPATWKADGFQEWSSQFDIYWRGVDADASPEPTQEVILVATARKHEPVDAASFFEEVRPELQVDVRPKKPKSSLHGKNESSTSNCQWYQ